MEGRQMIAYGRPEKNDGFAAKGAPARFPERCKQTDFRVQSGKVPPPAAVING